MPKLATSSLNSSLPLPLAFAVLALVPLGVGTALLAVRHAALHDSKDAQDWVATPCVMEKCELISDRSRNRHDIDTLRMVYRYHFAGREYRGGRPDLLAGSLGSDESWQKEVTQRFPPGSRAVCYVDPANPANSVFDRDRASQSSRPLALLAYPFLCVGLGFGLRVLRFFAASFDPIDRKRATAVRASKRQSKGRRTTDGQVISAHTEDAVASHARLREPGPPPRKLGWLNSAVVLSGPLNAQIAWIFVVGFSFIFVAMEGPAVYAELLGPRRDEAQVRGRVTRVHAIKQHELHETVFEYEVAYEVEGKSYTAKSFTRGKPYARGAVVPVVYDPRDPSTAGISGARRWEIPWWASAIPLTVLILLALGLTGMYVHNYRALQLLRSGEVAHAMWWQPFGAPMTNGVDSNPPGGALSHYHFDVAGSVHTAKHYGPGSAKKDAAEVVVLYNAASPNRNVILDEHLASLTGSGGSPSAFSRVLDCVNGPLAIGAIAVLLWL